MKHTGVPFDNIEMCMIILHTISFGLSMAYWANKGVGHFLMETRALIDNIELLEPQYECM